MPCFSHLCADAGFARCRNTCMPNVRSTYTDSVNFFGGENPLELATRFGTPLYVYNERILRQSCRELVSLSTHPGFFVNYSAKANTNPALLSIIREEGCVVDAMSPGEIYLNLRAGFTPDKILYVCNNVDAAELKNAVDNRLLVSVDSLSQLELYGRVNPGGKVMIRFNPGIGVGHSAKVVTGGKDTKFGVDPGLLDDALAIAARHNLRLIGHNQHIGTLFMEGASYVAAMDVLLGLAARLMEKGVTPELIDFGGGFGIPYHKYEGEKRLALAEFGTLLHRRISEWSAKFRYKGRFYIEPGRYIVAECGLVLGRVNAVKNNGNAVYAGTDIGFNVLARPMLYNAFHDVEVYREGGEPDENVVEQTVVGNICESGDILAPKRLLPRLREGDVLAMLDAGAYGYVMASTYNSRLRPAELLIGEDGAARLIRRRETLDDLASTLCALN